ncbi:MAG: hypothetical protein KGY68_06130 [Candidatus Thermoplasmatota archaeon]|nr:hypothetical protein [Candidatus Thermoplasmatota archaeon]
MRNDVEEISFKELLGYSIEGEEVAHEAYMEISEKLSGLASDRFQNLAKDELDHKQKLLKLHEHEFGDKEYIIPKGEGFPPHEGDFIKIDTDKLNSLISTLESAIEAEKDAYELYYRLAEKIGKHSALFNYIALMEKGHQVSLEEEKEMYEEILKEKAKREDITIDELGFSRYE